MWSSGVALIRQRDVLKSIHSIQQFFKKNTTHEQSTVQNLGIHQKTNHKIAVHKIPRGCSFCHVLSPPSSHRGALEVSSGSKRTGVWELACPSEATGRGGRENHLQLRKPLRRLSARESQGAWAGLLPQGGLGAMTNPQVTRARDTIHDTGRTRARGPPLLPSRCGQGVGRKRCRAGGTLKHYALI